MLPAAAVEPPLEKSPSASMTSWMSPAASLESHGYKPLKQLTGSTTATVLLVSRHAKPDEKFVVKTFGLGGGDAKGNRGVLQEIQLLKRLQHSYIIDYVESWWNGVGPNSRRLTVVMEFAEDGDLRAPQTAALRRGGRIDEMLIKRWLRQMLEGLEYIHGKNIIHRDLKAMNVFLKRSWTTCMIGDFGISAVLNEDTGVTGCVGTPAYMAPELVWNERYSTAIDMWSLGVIVYEMLALKLPFKANSLLAIVYQVAFNNVDEAPIRDAGYSDEIIILVTQLLTKEPSGRPSAASILHAEDAELWQGFSMEDSVQMALAAFAESRPPPMGNSGTWERLDETTMNDDNVMPIVAQTDDGKDSITGESLKSKIVQEGATEGPKLTVPSELPGIETTGDDSVVPAATFVAATVSDGELWEEIRRTRNESDTVPVERFVDLVSQLSIGPPPMASTDAASENVEDDLSTERASATDANLGDDQPAHREEADVRPATPADVSQEFKITLDRSSKAMLGMRVIGHPKGSGVLVKEVFEWGLVRDWNNANPELHVKSGFQVVEVNGIRDNSKLMLAKMAKARVLRMTLQCV